MVGLLGQSTCTALAGRTVKHKTQVVSSAIVSCSHCRQLYNEVRLPFNTCSKEKVFMICILGCNNLFFVNVKMHLHK